MKLDHLGIAVKSLDAGIRFYHDALGLEIAQREEVAAEKVRVAMLPLGDTRTLGNCAMLNLIGELPEPDELLAIPDAHLHVYGKALRPGRKVGHLTLRADSADQLEQRLRQLPAFFHREEFCLSQRFAHSAKYL